MTTFVNVIGPLLYMGCFAVILGGAFALMTQNLRSSERVATPRRRHPEAPSPGEEVMVVELSRERLEQLYAASSSMGHGA
ncbi:hypothetical protein KBZ18_14705 [Synechococcus sp. Cruz-9H2]|uniref:hypothetical protein n=1 Tax=unclassified Synechococcus TaxID=2626047 RepID=UPI0020CD513F|nr:MULTISPECIES: hypothetical protein [unclassified Synechococcus]MCP9820733.1 hypothetical protein [Synechococcus sp. Cruz-9H2]MCP9845011.1 hypothetical protein [Synechococcus sp. Edmonson 11F2]MCP9857132.1 hypothetical protein [Synechococcus sp. Cruz-9C9]MCP9864417.1 hypothetical protein [Synechococcus sp. Cruz-7E5]MCP9871643.1 hypothetical protein [Synechococcus sp. Cruz-7B9]